MVGYIKFYREQPAALAKNPNLFYMYWCLYSLALHTRATVSCENQVFELMPGDLVTGREKLSKETGFSPSKVYRLLRSLKRAKLIDVRTTNKFSIVSIRAWSKEQLGNFSRATHEQQADTFKDSFKNEKNDKSVCVDWDFALNKIPELSDVIGYLTEEQAEYINQDIGDRLYKQNISIVKLRERIARTAGVVLQG